MQLLAPYSLAMATMQENRKRIGRGDAWSESEVDLLTKLYPDTDTKQVAQLLNRSVRSVYMKAFNLGLAKSPEYLDDPTNPRRFTKKHRPRGNEGKGLPIPSPIGTIRINSYGLYEVKYTDKHRYEQAYKNWMPLLRFLWEGAGRTIPEGQFVAFKEGARTTNPHAISVDMLECVTMAEFSRRRSRQPKHVIEAEKTILEVLKEVHRARRTTTQGEPNEQDDTRS